jgi:hypothetical protein
MLDLTPDELLSTTRAVRKRLDVERPVADDLVRECVAAAQQVCLTPLAFTKGTDFKPALRPEPDTIIHWDTW